MDGLIRKGNDRRPRSRTAWLACGCGDQKERAGNTAQEKRREEQSACTAAAASIRPSHSPIKSHAPTPTPPPAPPPSTTLFRTHERSGYPCPADGRRHRRKKDPSRANANPSSPGKKVRKRRLFASCTGYSNNKAAAGREKISVDSFTVLFLRQILIPSPPRPTPSSTNQRIVVRRQATTTTTGGQRAGRRYKSTPGGRA